MDVLHRLHQERYKTMIKSIFLILYFYRKHKLQELEERSHKHGGKGPIEKGVISYNIYQPLMQFEFLICGFQRKKVSIEEGGNEQSPWMTPEMGRKLSIELDERLSSLKKSEVSRKLSLTSSNISGGHRRDSFSSLSLMDNGFGEGGG